MKPRMLVVEDEHRQREGIVRLFEVTITGMTALIERYGVSTFQVDAAATWADAERLLDHVSRRSSPYDVALLDMNLPRDADDPTTSLDVGRALLSRVVAEHASLALVVVSSYGVVANLAVEVLKNGATDFVSKPYGEEELVFATMQAWEKAWYRARIADQEKRYIRTLEQSRAEVADRFTSLITDSAGESFRNLDGLARAMEERYGLSMDRDLDDCICRAIRETAEIARNTVEGCRDLRLSLIPKVSELIPVDVLQVLREAANAVRPATVFHRTEVELPELPALEVRTSADDLRVLTEEILFSAIDASHDSVVIVSLEQMADAVVISVDDKAEPIPPGVCEHVNSGTAAEPGDGRGWGLYLAARIARNIGARMELSPKDSVGNRVTVRLPVT